MSKGATLSLQVDPRGRQVVATIPAVQAINTAKMVGDGGIPARAAARRQAPAGKATAAAVHARLPALQRQLRQRVRQPHPHPHLKHPPRPQLRLKRVRQPPQHRKQPRRPPQAPRSEAMSTQAAPAINIATRVGVGLVLGRAAALPAAPAGRATVVAAPAHPHRKMAIDLSRVFQKKS